MDARADGPGRWLDLVRILTARNLKIRYKGSVLGFLWSLLTPALTILMYAVFARILKFNAGQPHYLQFLVSGIIVWGFTAGCLNDSLYSIAGNANLVKKVRFPRAILPLSTAIANSVNFLLTFVPLALYLALALLFSFSTRLRVWAWTFAGIVATHYAYGWNFLRGLFARSMPDGVKAFDHQG